MSEILEKLKKRVQDNLEAVGNIDWAKELKYMTRLEERPRTPEPGFSSVLQKWERNAAYSGPAEAPSQQRIRDFVAEMPKGAEHEFTADSKLDRSQVVDGGTHHELDLFMAQMQRVYPRAMFPEAAWREATRKYPTVPPEEIEKAIQRRVPYEENIGTVRSYGTDLKLPKWRSATEGAKEQPQPVLERMRPLEKKTR